MQSNVSIQIEDPPIARALFGDTRFAWIWLIVRLYVGWEWLSEGIIKAQTSAWAGAKAGAFLTTWIGGALKKTQGAHPDVQGWYGSFLSQVVLPHAAFWSYVVTYGEIAVGLGLILGLFTGIAAFFGTTMNASYLLAGTVSTNPILFALGSLLVLAWKTAGWWGLGSLGTAARRHALEEREHLDHRYGERCATGGAGVMTRLAEKDLVLAPPASADRFLQAFLVAHPQFKGKLTLAADENYNGFWIALTSEQVPPGGPSVARSLLRELRVAIEADFRSQERAKAS